MGWIKIDPNFGDSPRMLRAGPLAGWLYVCGLCYCSRHQTGGIIPGAALPLLVDLVEILDCDAPVDVYALAEHLVTVGLWERAGGIGGDYRVLTYRQARSAIEKPR